MHMVTALGEMFQGPVRSLESVRSRNIALAVPDSERRQTEAGSGNTRHNAMIVRIGVPRPIPDQTGIRVSLIIKILNSALLNLGKQPLTADGGFGGPDKNTARANGRNRPEKSPTGVVT
jgi:hypothetical protein